MAEPSSIADSVYLALDILIAVVAMAVGFLLSMTLMRRTKGGTPPEESADLAKLREQVEFETERANMAVFQIRDLASNMAHDVGEHNTLVKNISSELGGMGKGSAADVASAISRMLAANNMLETRLAAAEQRITIQAEELKVQQNEARTDSLTTLANRRAFDDELRSSVALLVEAGTPCSLILLDIDHFKQFNDTHGHQAGDAVLRTIGKTLAKVVKNTDRPCRYGGEEFAIVLNGTTLDEANTAAERVRKAIGSSDVEFEDQTLQVTASLGVAECHRGEASAVLIRRADEGVYAAKEAGRNQTFFHDGSECRSVDEPVPLPPSGGEDEEGNAPSRHGGNGGGKTLAKLEDLPDRMVFGDELRRRISESRRFKLSLSVIRFHVSDYLGIESEYGEAVGRLILESVAQFIRATLRDMDLVAVFGPGEFGVMLPGSTVRDAERVGDRVSRSIQNCVLPLGGRELRLGVEWGAAEFSSEDDPATMLARAENAMREYEAEVSAKA